MEKQAFVDHFIEKEFGLHIDIYIYGSVPNYWIDIQRN